MKRIALAILLFFSLLTCNVEAGVRTSQTNLKISGTPMSSYAISNGVTVTSDSIFQTGNVGYGSMLLLTNASVTVSFQVSRDGTNWYTPYTTDGASLTSAGAIATAVSADRWIVLPVRMAPYIRFVFTANSSATVTAHYIWQLSEN